MEERRRQWKRQNYFNEIYNGCYRTDYFPVWQWNSSVCIAIVSFEGNRIVSTLWHGYGMFIYTMVIFSFFGGVIADRVNKRNIMVTLDFSTAGLIWIFYVVFQRLPLVPLMIVVLMVLYGISGAYQPAVQASIPLLAESENLMQANAVINMVGTLSGLFGPVIGGILFGSFGIKPILALSIICFLASAVMEIFIHIPYKKTSYTKGAAAIVKEDLKESWCL